MVSYPKIVGIRDPESGWRRIGVQDAMRGLDRNDEVMLNQVASFHTVLNEDVVAHAVVQYIMLISQIPGTMNRSASIKRIMDSVIPHVRFSHLANHVEVNWIATKLEGLSNIDEFCLFDSAND